MDQPATTNQAALRDLTRGSIPRHLLAFAVPMLLGNLLQALYNTVDAIWVGRFLGPAALGAVSVSFPVIFIMVVVIMGITMATTVMVAQYAGANRPDMVKRVINNSLTLLLVGGSTVSVLGVALHRPILRLIRTPPEIMADASAYLTIFMSGLMFLLGYNVLGAILRGLGDARTPLMFLVYATVTNIVLDPILIFGLGPIPRLGVRGAALATIIAQALTTVLAIRHLNRKAHLVTFNPREFRYDHELTRAVVRIGLPAGGQQAVVSIGSMVVVSIVNRFGHILTAAYGAGLRLDNFGILPAMSLGLAISALVGQNLGAGHDHRVRLAVRYGVLFSGSIACTIAVLVYALAPVLMAAFTRDPAVHAEGVGFLRVLAFGYVPTALVFALNGVMRGAGDTLPPMLISATTLWLVRVPLASYLSSTGLGPRGIWLAMVISGAVGATLSAGYYATGRWRRAVLVTAHERRLPRPAGEVTNATPGE